MKEIEGNPKVYTCSMERRFSNSSVVKETQVEKSILEISVINHTLLEYSVKHQVVS